jgi:hypothetical protein
MVAFSKLYNHHNIPMDFVPGPTAARLGETITYAFGNLDPSPLLPSLPALTGLETGPIGNLFGDDSHTHNAYPDTVIQSSTTHGYTSCPKKPTVITWYCHECGDGPLADWNHQCSCEHIKCCYCKEEEI